MSLFVVVDAKSTGLFPLDAALAGPSVRIDPEIVEN